MFELYYVYLLYFFAYKSVLLSQRVLLLMILMDELQGRC